MKRNTESRYFNEEGPAANERVPRQAWEKKETNGKKETQSQPRNSRHGQESR